MSFPESATELGSDEYYRWKFRGLPAEPPSYEYAAYRDDQLVGYFAALPYDYIVEGRHVTCGSFCDVMTHPDMRRKGVFSQLGRFANQDMAEAGLSFATAFVVRPAVMPGYLAAGWKTVFRLPVYVKVLRTRSLLNAHALRGLSPAIDFALALSSKLRRRHPRYDVAVLDRSAALELRDYDEFQTAWQTSRANVLVKSRQFLTWRTGAPNATYRFLSIRDSGKLIGMTLFRVTTLQGIPALAILDFMALPRYRHLFADSDRILAPIAVNEGADVIATMMSPTTAREHRLTQLGYIPSPARFSLFVKSLHEEQLPEECWQEKRWHLMWVDCDDL